MGIILESIDLPVTFPTAFYCRREKSENTTVAFETFEDEKIFSDIFHIKVSDVNRDCKARIYLPLYVAASDNEEIVLRFKNCADEDHVADERIERDGVSIFEKVRQPDFMQTVHPGEREGECLFLSFVLFK